MIRLVLALICINLAGCVSAPATEPAELIAGGYELDAAHTDVTWRVKHMGLTWYTARFDEAEASLNFDPDAPEAAELTAIIRADSISTGDPDFDEQLLGSGWFDAERHRELVFRSTRIEMTGETSGRVHGDLTIKGVTQPVVLDTEFYGGITDPFSGRQRLGFGADLVINRTDFDIAGFGSRFVGEEVRIRIEAEFLEGED